MLNKSRFSVFFRPQTVVRSRKTCTAATKIAENDLYAGEKCMSTLALLIGTLYVPSDGLQFQFVNVSS